ncbi:MAG: SEC-C domain-containing protein [Candidatus Electronema sp. V4]|uniref:SEC-C domain-containing protein n=1 Tax=Candidatus Electronema sp. V4 TaxID=3454756 RepID=UPI004055437A
MSKISRNQPCPCQSGKKYKHCCLPLAQAGLPPAPVRQEKISLLGEVAKIQQAAQRRQEVCRMLGVFILFSTKDGDALVLETTERDAFQAAAAGQPLPPPIQEELEMIEVDWSHAFALRGRSFVLTSHADGMEAVLEAAPVQQISAAVRRISRQYPAELLRQVHVRQP